jgi:hypothetical protein
LPANPRVLSRVTFGVLAAAVAAPFAVQPRTLAFPELKKKEGVSCVYCHVKPGGPRNYRGKFYKQNKNSFENFDDAAAAYAAGEERLPTKDPKPKTLTTPTPVSDAQDKVMSARESLAKSPKDTALAQSYSDALAGLAKAILTAQNIPAEARFTQAAKICEEGVKVEKDKATGK